jgi:hypothetical protein
VASAINKANNLEEFLRLDSALYANRDIKSYEITIKAQTHIVWEHLRNYKHLASKHEDTLDDIFSQAKQGYMPPKIGENHKESSSKILGKYSKNDNRQQTICTKNLRAISVRDGKRRRWKKGRKFSYRSLESIRCALCMSWKVSPHPSYPTEFAKASVTYYLSAPIFGGKDFGKMLFKNDSVPAKMFQMTLNTILVEKRSELTFISDTILLWVKESSEISFQKFQSASLDTLNTTNKGENNTRTISSNISDSAPQSTHKSLTEPAETQSRETKTSSSQRNSASSSIDFVKKKPDISSETPSPPKPAAKRPEL